MPSIIIATNNKSIFFLDAIDKLHAGVDYFNKLTVFIHASAIDWMLTKRASLSTFNVPVDAPPAESVVARGRVWLVQYIEADRTF